MEQSNYLEQLRKKAMFTFIAMILMIIMTFMAFFASRSFIVIPFFVGIIVLAFVSNKFSNDYRQTVKHQIVKDMLDKEFNNVRFNPDEGYSREFIKDTELLSMGNRYSSNDLLTGDYHDVKFSQADVHIQQHTQNGKTSSTVTLFKGRYMVYTFNKHFTGYMQIRSNENHLFGNSKPMRFFSDRPETSRVKLENEEFNKRFNVYASDDHEAFYILTPHFMEKIMELDDDFAGNLVLGFIDNQLHLALYNNEDAFEPSLFSPVDDAYLQAVQNDIDVIKMVIDELTLDVSLYK